MIELRPVLLIIGILLTILAVAMVMPAVVDALSPTTTTRDWDIFVAVAAFTLFIGMTLILTSRGGRREMDLRQMFLLTTSLWVVMSAFSALPFMFGETRISFTDAFFEAMSGITTTGSTVMTGLENQPAGILLWRAQLQWLGGIGIVVMALLILPQLHVGGMQLFRMESSDRSEKALPRTAQNVGGVTILYMVLTATCAFGYWVSGMSGFDAVAHAMTTVSTGGFSTYDTSLGAFDHPGVQWVGVVFMILGSLPFILYVRSLRSVRGRARNERYILFKDSQVRWFISILLIAIIVLILHRLSIGQNLNEPMVRHSVFNIVSVMTGTGYASTNYGAWGPFAATLFFFIMFLGGCAGSTTCGVKIFRVQVLYETAKIQIQRLISPNGVFLPYYNGRPIPEDVSTSVMSFFYFFVLCFALLAVALGLTGLDFITAVSAAATSIANVGPGLGPIVGPAGNFSTIPDTAKWLMALGMLLGRLELFTVLVLLSPAFWRR